jgi:hypothetical protein
MLSVRNQKGLGWFCLCGCISSFCFFAGAVLYVELAWQGSAVDIAARLFMWPIGSFILGIVSILWIRALYRREERGFKLRVRFGVADLLLITGVYAVIALFWTIVSRPTFLSAGLPSLIILSLLLLTGMIYADSRGIQKRLLRLIVGIGFGSALFARLVVGGFIVSMIVTLPFHLSLMEWFRIFYYQFGDPFGSIRGDAAEVWFTVMCRIGMFCLPASFICDQISSRMLRIELKGA